MSEYVFLYRRTNESHRESMGSAERAQIDEAKDVERNGRRSTCTVPPF
jgi:hypothetical protein